jgi:RNA recognition motif-containing protein
MNIYVGNLDYEVKESELEEIFAAFGTITSVRIISDKFTGRSKGFGFVIMENQEEANKAIGELNGTELDNRTILVNEARPKKNHYNN